MKQARSKRLHARAEETRKDLLAAALRLFSARGFEGVSTRELADAAGATLSSIPYHFGSKEGLYQAVLVGLDEGMRERLAPVLAATHRVLERRSSTRRQKLDALKELVTAHARTIFDSQPEWISLVLHEQMRSIESSLPNFDVTATETILTAMRLVAGLRKLPVTNPAVRLQSIMLFGRASILRAFPFGTFTLMERKELTPSHIGLVIEIIRTEIETIFSPGISSTIAGRSS